MSGANRSAPPSAGSEVGGRAWQPNTAYKANDLVVQAGVLYRANADFTSAASFNAANWTVVATGSSGGQVSIDTTAPASVNPGDLHVQTDGAGNPISLFTAAGPFAGTVVVSQSAPGASIAADSLYVQTDANGVVTNLYAGAA